MQNKKNKIFFFGQIANNEKMNQLNIKQILVQFALIFFFLHKRSDSFSVPKQKSESILSNSVNQLNLLNNLSIPINHPKKHELMFITLKVS